MLDNGMTYKAIFHTSTYNGNHARDEMERTILLIRACGREASIRGFRTSTYNVNHACNEMQRSTLLIGTCGREASFRDAVRD